MAAVTITIEPDELAGVCALLEVEKAAEGGTAGPPTTADVTTVARALMRRALAARLADSGLPWAPSPDAVRRRAAEAARPGSVMRRLARNRRVRKYAASAALVAALIVLWGGFTQGWTWTGFQHNDQLWSWLHLLLLPVVIPVVLPRAVDWVSGSAARRAEEARAAPDITPALG